MPLQGPPEPRLSFHLLGSASGQRNLRFCGLLAVSQALLVHQGLVFQSSSPQLPQGYQEGSVGFCSAPPPLSIVY